MVSEAQKRASAKYVRENVKRKTVSLFWSSADLTGNQTREIAAPRTTRKTSTLQLTKSCKRVGHPLPRVTALVSMVALNQTRLLPARTTV